MYQTQRRWWTVADAAQMLRVHTDTLYDACAADDFPHIRVGGVIKIPCEALRMTYVPDPVVRWELIRTGQLDPAQLELPLDPSCLVPVRRFRNTREVIKPFHYEGALYGGRVRRTP